MSEQDLIDFVNKLHKEPQDPIEPSSFDKLAAEGRDMDSIVSQRDIELDYDSTVQDNFLIGGVLPTDPSDVSQPDVEVVKPTPDLDMFLLTRDTSEPISTEQFAQLARRAEGEIAQEKGKVAVEKAAFAADYISRLIRSAMAVTGISATTERFGDIRKSHNFWIAMMDLMHTVDPTSPNIPAIADISEKQAKQVKEIPGILTDPKIPTETLPGIGKGLTQLGTPEELEWVYDVAGEIVIEARITGAVKKAAKFGMSKFTKKVYESGEEAAKKGGVKRLLGSFTNEEISALAQARKAKKVGLLGTRPIQEKIDDAISRTFDYITETADARLTKKKAISIKRKAGAARLYDVQGEGYGVGYSKRLRKAGTISKTESSFVPFLDAAPAAADDYVTLQKTVDNFDFGGSKIYTTTNAQEALEKLYETGELLTAGDVEHLRDIFGQDFANALNKFIDKPTGVAGMMLEAGSEMLRGLSATSRTLMTTGELSFLIRQGNFRAWIRPADAIRSYAVASRALASPKYARYWDEAMRGSAKGKDAIEKGLFLGRFGDDVKLTAREEFFNAEWLKGVPVLGKTVKRFEAAYVVGLNQLRMDWFDEGMQLIRQSGKAGDDKLTASWAAYVNNMTGRADLDALINQGLGPKADKIMENMVGTAKNVLFAPRFAASKWNKHRTAAVLIFGDEAPAALRSMIVTDTMLKWRRYERLAHYAKQGGYEVEEDPRSSDYLKFKRGNTRFDVLGGDAQLMVLIARLATGETKDTTTGEVKENIASKLIQDHAAGKLNPAVSLMYDKFIAKETFRGEDINDPEVLARTIREKFIPLFIQDVGDKIRNGYEEEGLTVAESIEQSTSTMMMGWVGAGIQTYPPSARKKIELLYNESANKLYVKDFPDLTVSQKQEAMFEAEIDHGEEIAELKAEAGMNTLSPGGASRIQEFRNKSTRIIRKGLGDDFKLFSSSMVSVGSMGIDIEDVRLNTKQHKRLNDLYVDFMKKELKMYPDIELIAPRDPTRIQWLEDIRDQAKEMAVDELFFEQPKRQSK
jgi:hypothetical protein